MDPLNVLFASAGFSLPGGIANLDRSVLTALDELSASTRLGNISTISLRGRVPRRPSRSGTSVVAGPDRARFVFSLLRLVLRAHPDLLLFDHVRLARAVRTVPGPMRPAYAVMVHGVELDPPLPRNAVPLLREAGLVIANSERTAGRVTELTGAGPGDRIRVLNPCVSRERIQAWSGEPVPPVSDRPPQVLVASRLEASQPGKGHEALIEAWPTVRDAVPGAKLIVAGDGDKRAALEHLAAERGVVDSVEFTGYVSTETLGGLYRDSAVYAMPSSQEGFGIVYAEAMWHGTPCIGSTADAAGEVIVDGETGILVPYGDAEATATATIRLLSDKDVATRMSQAARRRALERYTPDAFRERLVEILESLPG